MPINTRTNILATLGPASDSKEVISAMVDAGIDGFRLNFSHGTHESHERIYNIIREVSKSKNAHIAVVADLQGPKLRIVLFKKDSVKLK